MAETPPIDHAIAAQFGNLETTLCLSTKVIVITEDRLELQIDDGLNKLRTRDFWIAPLGLFTALLATLLTADFKNLTWVSSGTLKGVFISATVASLVWLVHSLSRLKQPFGRAEFMASIKNAGSPYRSPVPITGTASMQLPALGTEATGNVSFQCRQCGTLLPEPIQNEVTRCPACGNLA